MQTKKARRKAGVGSNTDSHLYFHSISKADVCSNLQEEMSLLHRLTNHYDKENE